MSIGRSPRADTWAGGTGGVITRAVAVGTRSRCRTLLSGEGEQGNFNNSRTETYMVEVLEQKEKNVEYR